MAMTGLGVDSEEELPKPKKGKVVKKGKRVRKVNIAWEDEDAEDEEPLRNFMVYLDIKGPKVAAAGGSCSQAAPPLTVKCGPFFHKMNESFASIVKTCTSDVQLQSQKASDGARSAA